MVSNVQFSNGIELSKCDKERQEQRLLSYVRKCVERKGGKEPGWKV